MVVGRGSGAEGRVRGKKRGRGRRKEGEGKEYRPRYVQTHAHITARKKQEKRRGREVTLWSVSRAKNLLLGMVEFSSSSSGDCEFLLL